MTELEKMKRAKMYMEKLANGINPIDDSPVPDGDTVNNVRIPDGAGIALLLERHAYGDPVGTGKFGYIYGLEGRENIGIHVLCSFRSVCTGVVAVRNTPVVIGKP